MCLPQRPHAQGGPHRPPRSNLLWQSRVGFADPMGRDGCNCLYWLQRPHGPRRPPGAVSFHGLKRPAALWRPNWRHGLRRRRWRSPELLRPCALRRCSGPRRPLWVAGALRAATTHRPRRSHGLRRRQLATSGGPICSDATLGRDEPLAPATPMGYDHLAARWAMPTRGASANKSATRATWGRCPPGGHRISTAEGLTEDDLRAVDYYLLTLPMPDGRCDPVSKLRPFHARRGGRPVPKVLRACVWGSGSG